MTHRKSLIVEELNHLLAEEVEAFLRYFQLRYRLRAADLPEVKPFFDQALQETIEHAEAIAGHIQSLGHVPKLSLKPAIGGGVVTREEALAEALEFERQALEAYQDMLPRVAGNASLEKFIQQQITVETEHVQEIERMLD